MSESSVRTPSPQKMWGTYNFGCLLGVGYTRAQSRSDVLHLYGLTDDDWPQIRDRFQSHKILVTVRDEAP